MTPISSHVARCNLCSDTGFLNSPVGAVPCPAVDCAASKTYRASKTPDTNFIADEAKRIVSGARQAEYGGVEDNFAAIARFWTAYFQNTGRGIEVTAQDVSPLMRLLKEARLCSSPDHLDSHIDLVGYALTGARANKVKIPVDDA